MRTGTVANLFESGSCETYSQFGTFELANFCPEFGGIELDVLIGTRSWSFFVGEVPSDSVYGLRAHGI